jgi:hypothetical protein
MTKVAFQSLTPGIQAGLGLQFLVKGVPPRTISGKERTDGEPERARGHGSPVRRVSPILVVDLLTRNAEGEKVLGIKVKNYEGQDVVR